MVFIVVTFPVETIKPFVFLNVPNTSFLITQSLCAVISEGRERYKDISHTDSHSHLQSFLMSSLALAVMFLGKSMASMPFRIIL